jgi:tetratricopeptide (TPR) repeat protein
LALLEYYAGHFPEADRASAAAFTHAQDLDLPDATLSQLFLHRGTGHRQQNRPAQGVAYMREALYRAEKAQDPAATGVALSNLADMLLTSEPSAAVDAARIATAHARRIGHRGMLSAGVCNLMQALLLLGDWDEIERIYQETERDGASDDPAIAYSIVLLRAFRCDSPGLRAALPLLAPWRDTEDPQDTAEAATALAAAALCTGEHAEALNQARRALSHVDTLSFHHDGTRWAWAIAADAATELHDRAEAIRLVESLDTRPPGRIPRVLHAERLRIIARLMAAGDDSGTDSAFDSALNAFRDLGSPYHLAAGLLDHAGYRADAGDAQSAHQLADEAGAIAGRLGAKRLTERAERLRTPRGSHQRLQCT